MKKIIESMAKQTFDTYFTNGIKNWGDQIDVFDKVVSTSTDLDNNGYVEVSMIRVNANEFTNVNDIRQKAEIEFYGESENLKAKNEELKQGLIDANDMIAMLAEEI